MKRSSKMRVPRSRRPDVAWRPEWLADERAPVGLYARLCRSGRSGVRKRVDAARRRYDGLAGWEAVDADRPAPATPTGTGPGLRWSAPTPTDEPRWRTPSPRMWGALGVRHG